MDPNVTLALIRANVAYLRDPILSANLLEETIEELTEDVMALDEWLTKDGFLPKAWLPAPEHG